MRRAALPAAAMGQPSAVLDALPNRAHAAISGIQRREPLRHMLAASLALRGFGKADPIKALLYRPEKVSGPTPAIVILNPHEDPSSGDAVRLASSLARLGFIVISPDVREHHARLDMLVDGVTPHALIQHDVRAALGYLISSGEVDRTRIAHASA